jgi:hypothetical protein
MLNATTGWVQVLLFDKVRFCLIMVRVTDIAYVCLRWLTAQRSQELFQYVERIFLANCRAEARLAGQSACIEKVGGRI